MEMVYPTLRQRRNYAGRCTPNHDIDHARAAKLVARAVNIVGPPLEARAAAGAALRVHRVPGGRKHGLLERGRTLLEQSGT